MADARRFGFSPQLDIGQLVVEAQQRWLRPAEICEILRNYREFRIAPEPPNMPPSGSLFLFDRKVLRYFRKDGHTWRKKKDGKTVKEAHERLKAESIDVLHCYYAHGEENENFQRRTYWMLEEAFMHIVLVHYLEVKGNKTSSNRVRDAEGITHAAHMDSPACSNSTMENQIPSHTTDTESTNSVHMSEYEDAESDNYQARSRYHPFIGLQQYEDGSMKDVYSVGPYTTVPSIINHCDTQRPQAITSESDFYSVSQEDKTEVFNDASLGLTSSVSRSQVKLTSWDEVLEHCTAGFPSDLQTSLENIGGNWEREALTFGDLTDDLNIKLKSDSMGQGRDEFQFPCGEVGSSMTSNINLENNLALEGIANSLSLLKQPSLDLSNIQGEGLKKFDSFTRWMSKELGEVESNIRPSYETYWNSVDNGSTIEDSSMSNPEHLDAYVMSPSVSQDQLFSIIDFFPSWAYTVSETKVLITGSFLKNKKDLENCKWSCMFGEVEVPAEVLVEGLLSCHAPPHKSGTFPFYVTCSNRLACSEVREFEYRVCDTQYLEASDSYSHNYTEMNLQTRLDKLLSLESVSHSVPPSSITSEKRHLSSKISSLLLEADDEWTSLLGPARDEGFSSECMQDLLLQKVLKQRLHDWLIQKLVEDGKGPNVFDKEGQGVLHLAAALGYDWAIKPTITAGVKIDFRDVRGWTALHWAAFCGREKTVISLISLGADPGTLTDPTPGFPSRTPADLASGNGQKGIAGFLAESSLTSHLSALTLKDTGGIDIAEVSGVKPIESIEEQSPIQVVGDDMQASLKDSLSAVRNASLAAARIHQVFRVQSFQRKKVVEYGDDKCGISEERALSLISVKKGKPGQRDMPVLDAAVRIQNKFRGWKGRKEFLIIRQRIVKIQAHVRGFQVRKRYKKITWTVGIVEKVILRWRRKRIGFRGFRGPEGLPEGPAMQTEPPVAEDDYDFFRDGRKQTEMRLEKALARVKSMVHYPEARDQYHRLLTAMQNKSLNESEEAVDEDAMIDDLEELWGDDAV